MRGDLKILCFGVFIFLVAGLGEAVAQPSVLKQVPGMPSSRVYDLFTDSKGFLWIGHAGGVSKYDGISFTGYSNAQQSSLAVTGFVEDKYGRIWFNNFTGQIFYVENGRVHLLEAYDNMHEPDFPNIGLFKDLLVATTKKGLFVCDTKTLKCHYESCKNLPANGTTSLSIFKNEVIVFGYRKWFCYKPGRGLKPAHFNSADSLTINRDEGELTTRTFNDTAFVPCNPRRNVYKIIAVNDSLRVCGIRHFKYYINGVMVLKSGYWVNTSRVSSGVPGAGNLKDLDLSCETIDKQGHYWFGSLQSGLLTDFTNSGLVKNGIKLPLSKGDKLNCLSKSGNRLLIGTDYGKLISYDPVTNTSQVLTQLLSKHNGVTYIKMLDADNAIVGSPDHTFIFNLPANKVRQTYRNLVMRQADTINRSIVFATASGLIAVPYKSTPASYDFWKNDFNHQFKGFNEYLEGDGPYKFLDYVQRTIAVCSLPKNNSIWAALKNGLYTINRGGATPYYFNSQPVFASCLTTYNNQVIAGTINNGVLIINGKKVKHLFTADGLLSSNIVQVKIAGSNLFIYDSGLVQMFNPVTFKMLDKYQLPGMNDGVVTDAEEIDNQLFLANANGLFKIPRVKNKASGTSLCLSSLNIDGRDTDKVNNVVLSHEKNNVQINLGIPDLLNGKDFIIKYRLHANGGNEKWSYGQVGERSFRFNTLSPGSYQFEALSGRLQTGISGGALKINFTIMPPWWRTWWAMAGMAMISLLIILAIVRLYYNNILAAEKTEFEKKLAIERERQRISSDMHDDIGASLSAIKLFTGNVKQAGGAATGIPEIYEMVSELSDRTREVIWSLNKVYDTLESLIYFIDSTAGKMFEHSGIEIKTILPDHIPNCKIDNDKRRDVYLILKEALHNIIKHSKATEALLEFSILNDCLNIKIQDNGSGIPIYPNGKINGQGMVNIKNRVKNLSGEVVIECAKGTIINLMIPL